MTGLIIRRLLQLPLIVLAVYTITFALAWALPGSAVLNDEGRRPPPEIIAAMEAQYNLHDPSAFYFDYLARASGAAWVSSKLAQGSSAPPAPVFDFGPSLRYEDWSVNELIAASLPVSVTLGTAAIFLAVVMGVAAGAVGAARPNSPLDLATLALALVGVSLPSFVVGAALLMIFPLWLGVGSVGGWGSFQDLLLPAFTLSLPFTAYIARLTRMAMIDTLDADYIRTARAKGLTERRVHLTHALRHAMLPVVSYLGPAAASALTGSFVVEQVFNVPGLGQHFVNAVKNKDLFVIMGVTIIYSVILVVMNLLVDVLNRWIDPRIEC